jgi:hypothetical protein
VSWRTALMTPAGTPSTIEMMVASTASSMVTGIMGLMICHAGES